MLLTWLQNGKASLGDLIHRYITSDQFSPECLLGCIDLSSEHQALEIANRVEASIYIWRRKTHSKPLPNTHRSNSKTSWEMVKDLVIDADKREVLADRAESLLLCLKQRFPGLPQTTLDMSKIQYNKVSLIAIPYHIIVILLLGNRNLKNSCWLNLVFYRMLANPYSRATPEFWRVWLSTSWHVSMTLSTWTTWPSILINSCPYRK